MAFKKVTFSCQQDERWPVGSVTSKIVNNALLA